jgi:tetratricopeptide (TPR) repeat protein
MRLNPSLRTVDIVAAMSNYEAISDATSGREDVAISYFSKVITNNPMAYDAYNNRAVAYLKKGEIEKAAADYRTVTIIAPSFSFAPYFDLGMIEFNKGNITSAIPMFHESIKLNPEHAESHFYLAAALDRLGRLSESAPHLDTALKLKPSLSALLNIPAGTNTLAQPRAAPLPRAP